MFELVNKLMDFSFSNPAEGHPGGFLVFFFVTIVAVTIIWVTYYIFDMIKEAMENIVRWRSNVAESRAKAKKNDMAPKIIEGQIDLNYKMDQLSEELKNGILHLSEKK